MLVQGAWSTLVLKRLAQAILRVCVPYLGYLTRGPGRAGAQREREPGVRSEADQGPVGGASDASSSLPVSRRGCARAVPAPTPRRGKPDRAGSRAPQPHAGQRSVPSVLDPLHPLGSRLDDATVTACRSASVVVPTLASRPGREDGANGRAAAPMCKL